MLSQREKGWLNLREYPVLRNRGHEGSGQTISMFDESTRQKHNGVLSERKKAENRALVKAKSARTSILRTKTKNCSSSITSSIRIYFRIGIRILVGMQFHTEFLFRIGVRFRIRTRFSIEIRPPRHSIPQGHLIPYRRRTPHWRLIPYRPDSKCDSASMSHSRPASDFASESDSASASHLKSNSISHRMQFCIVIPFRIDVRQHNSLSLRVGV